jgi:hypothetical protein
VLFFNTSREIFCVNCEEDLQESYVLSAPNSRYRCIPCATNLNILLEIPDFVQAWLDEVEEELKIVA